LHTLLFLEQLAAIGQLAAIYIRTDLRQCLEPIVKDNSIDFTLN